MAGAIWIFSGLVRSDLTDDVDLSARDAVGSPETLGRFLSFLASCAVVRK